MKVCKPVFSQVSTLATVTAAADLWSVLCSRTIRSAGSYEECYLSVACLRATQSAIPRTTSSTLTLDHIIRGCTIIPGWNIATIFCLNMWYYDIRSGYIFTDTSRDTGDYKQFINHHYHRISCEYAALNKQSVYFVARCLLVFIRDISAPAWRSLCLMVFIWIEFSKLNENDRKTKEYS